MTEKEVGVYRRYEPRKRLHMATMERIDLCGQILEEYESQGHVMTVRQVYYQMVARGLTGGENSGSMYDKIQHALNVGRMQGLLSWTALEDRTRSLMGLDHYTSLRSCLETTKNSFRHDLWERQHWRPEVWIEKDALIGVVANICNRLRVDFFACRGYNSQSEQWRAGRRFADRIQRGQRPIVFHLGDHDPSGIHMTEDNRKRLEEFAGTPIIVQRLALNMPQIEELNPPPNPTKDSDARAKAYEELYGDLSWELDALDPPYIENLIEQAVLKVRDNDLWEEALEAENADLAQFELLIEEHT